LPPTALERLTAQPMQAHDRQAAHRDKSLSIVPVEVPDFQAESIG